MKRLAARLRSPFARLLLAAVLALGAAATSHGAVFVSATIAPPALPVYAQPLCPGPGFIWIPGYWAWGPSGYYWVPGYWARAPFVGALWTPGYWGWAGGVYVWHPGYWGPRVGFYGGVNYGFGYFGVGYVGGYWSNGVFNYNTTVNNIDVTRIHNTYNRQVTVNAGASRVSYNGGAGGIAAQPTAEERLAERDRHRGATPMQTRHERVASTDRGLLASVNHGTPSLAATPRAGAFRERGAGPGPGANPDNMPRHAERSAAPHPRGAAPETHAQGAPHPQGPRSQPQGEPRGGHQGGERHQEGHGGR